VKATVHCLILLILFFFAIKYLSFVCLLFVVFFSWSGPECWIFAVCVGIFSHVLCWMYILYCLLHCAYKITKKSTIISLYLVVPIVGSLLGKLRFCFGFFYCLFADLVVPNVGKYSMSTSSIFWQIEFANKKWLLWMLGKFSLSLYSLLHNA